MASKKGGTKMNEIEVFDAKGGPWGPGAGMQYRRFGRTELKVPVPCQIPANHFSVCCLARCVTTRVLPLGPVLRRHALHVWG